LAPVLRAGTDEPLDRDAHHRGDRVLRTQAQAEAALGDVLRDEPEWKGELGVIAIEFDMSPQ
jgi:hypothetical protein